MIFKYVITYTKGFDTGISYIEGPYYTHLEAQKAFYEKYDHDVYHVVTVKWIKE